MANQTQVDQIKQALIVLKQFKAEDLINRPKDWGKFNFERWAGDIEGVLSVANDLALLPVEQIPANAAIKLLHTLEQLHSFLSKINKFDITEGGEAAPRLEELGTKVANAYGVLVNVAGPWMAMHGARPREEVDLKNEIERVRAEAAASLESVRQEAETKTAQIESLLEAARSSLSSTGAAVLVDKFGGEADVLSEQAKNWLKATAGTATITLVVPLLMLWLWPIPDDASISSIAQHVTTKLFTVALLLSATLWEGKIYRALRHLESLNRHRSHALNTFSAFVESAGQDKQTRNAVLVEATKSIFGIVPQGFIDGPAAKHEGSLQIVEMISRGVEKATE